MTFSGLTIDPQRLARVIGREGQGRSGSGRVGLGKQVTAYAIESTRTNKCKCESRGLHEGMTLQALRDMGAGCTAAGVGGGWVCNRLMAVRRVMGV